MQVMPTDAVLNVLCSVQVRGSLNMGTAEAEQCAICMEHNMEAAIQECSHEVSPTWNWIGEGAI